MSYVSVDAPLPRNGRSPVPSCEIAAARAQVQNVEDSVRRAKAASSQIATPESFAGLGEGVQRDVQRSQKELVAALKFQSAPKTMDSREAMRSAPTVLPLNVPVEEYSGCSVRGIGPISPMVVAQDQQRVVMPPPAPTDTNLLLPQNTGMAPATSARGGFPSRGYYGMAGVPWGDAIADPRARMGNGGSGISGKMLFWLGVAGVGLYAMGKKGRR